MNAPAEITTPSPDYLRVLEALVQINEPAERERIATKADISPDGAGVQLVALAGKRIVVRCPQPKGAPALWSLAVSLDTARQMVAGMKRAAAEASPAADDRRRIIAAMREFGEPASASAIAKKSGVEMSNFSLFLEAMAADGVIQRIGGTSGQRPKFALAPSVQSQTPAATDGEPGDDEPAPEPGDTQAVANDEPPEIKRVLDGLDAELSAAIEAAEHQIGAAPTPDADAAILDDPDNFGDDEMQTAAPDPDGWIPWRGGECPVPKGASCWIMLRNGAIEFHDNPSVLWWEWYNDGSDIVAYNLEKQKPEHVITPAYSSAVAAESAADSAPLTGDDVCGADAVIAEWKREHGQPAIKATPDAFAVWLADTPAGCAGQRAIDAAEQEAARLRAEAAEMVREAAEALEFGLIVAEIIRFADRRNVSTSTSEEEFGLAELMAAAYEAVTGKRVA